MKRLSRITLLLAAVLLMAACGVSKKVQQPTAEQLEALRRYVHPLRTAVPDGGDDSDLAILQTLLADARIVGLGEATHGTHEIFQMKDRLVRYLARNMGFDVFSIEDQLPQAAEVNRYIQGDSADWQKELPIIFWRTEEVREMVEWMRRYNAGEPKIAFTGFDMQRAEGALRELARPDAALPDRQAWLARNRRIVEQQTALSKTSKPLAKSKLRDRYMAENIEWIKQQNPGSKMVVWAHNLHIQNRRKSLIPGTFVPMGHHLKNRYGDGYMTVGFALGEGTYTAVSRETGVVTSHHRLTPPPAGSYEQFLSLLEGDLFLVDLKRIRAEGRDNMRWFNRYRQGGYNIGAGAVEDRFHLTNLTRDFDYLIFIRNSTASRLLPGQNND